MSLDSDSDFLSSLPIFSLLERESLRLLAFQAKKREFQSGENLIEFGKPADGGMVLLEGSATQEIEDKIQTATNIHRKTLNSGALIGQLALITTVVHRTTFRASEPTRVMVIERDSFLRILKEYPDCAAKVRAAIAQDLMDLTQSLSNSRKHS